MNDEPTAGEQVGAEHAVDARVDVDDEDADRRFAVPNQIDALLGGHGKAIDEKLRRFEVPPMPPIGSVSTLLVVAWRRVRRRRWNRGRVAMAMSVEMKLIAAPVSRMKLPPARLVAEADAHFEHRNRRDVGSGSSPIGQSESSWRGSARCSDARSWPASELAICTSIGQLPGRPTISSDFDGPDVAPLGESSVTTLPTMAGMPTMPLTPNRSSNWPDMILVPGSEVDVAEGIGDFDVVVGRDVELAECRRRLVRRTGSR